MRSGSTHAERRGCCAAEGIADGHGAVDAERFHQRGDGAGLLVWSLIVPACAPTSRGPADSEIAYLPGLRALAEAAASGH